MSIATIVIICITAGIHVIGLGLFFIWMAAGSPMSMDKLKVWLNAQHLPFMKTKRDPTHPSERVARP